MWYSGGKNGETGLYWSQSQDNGASFGARRLVSAGLTQGTPVLLVTNGAFTGVWEGNESGKSKVRTAKLDAAPTSSESFIAAPEGELPAAAATKDRVVIAYVATSDQQQSVWVVYERSV